ncbi:hypothetical protein MCOR34_001118 [Pyricularia oryzae]|nr:hypothetical protein MCOR34_001118 [Pyricularia oryzae]KAI6473660.1 hypothetical protein MCOR17_002533 [Pyricularia oryzae]
MFHAFPIFASLCLLSLFSSVLANDENPLWYIGTAASACISEQDGRLSFRSAALLETRLQLLKINIFPDVLRATMEQKLPREPFFIYGVDFWKDDFAHSQFENFKNKLRVQGKNPVSVDHIAMDFTRRVVVPWWTIKGYEKCTPQYGYGPVKCTYHPNKDFGKKPDTPLKPENYEFEMVWYSQEKRQYWASVAIECQMANMGPQVGLHRYCNKA